jgi:hypothetical protein
MRGRGTVAVLLVVGWLALVAPAGASHLIRRALPELTAGAAMIFVGRCESVTCHWNHDRSQIQTANRFRVLRVLKGASLATITLEELGGTVGDTLMVVPEVPRYAVGEEVLLFVHRTPLGRWETFGAGQGRFRLAYDTQGRPRVHSDFYHEELSRLALPERPGEGAPLARLVAHLRSYSNERTVTTRGEGR